MRATGSPGESPSPWRAGSAGGARRGSAPSCSKGGRVLRTQLSHQCWASAGWCSPQGDTGDMPQGTMNTGSPSCPTRCVGHWASTTPHRIIGTLRTLCVLPEYQGATTHHTPCGIWVTGAPLCPTGHIGHPSIENPPPITSHRADGVSGATTHSALHDQLGAHTELPAHPGSRGPPTHP